MLCAVLLILSACSCSGLRDNANVTSLKYSAIYVSERVPKEVAIQIQVFM